MTQLSGLLSTQGRGRKIRMTSHPKRPRDPNQLAKSIIDIATGRGGEIDTIFRFEKEADALQWIKEKSQA